MPDDIRETVLYKLRYTPVRDFLRAGFTGTLDFRRPIEEAALPTPIGPLIERVVRKTRLWRLEKLDVTAELIGHFADGIASGSSPEDLIRLFGNEARAAQLIRRAKRRNRPLFWRALHAAALFMLLIVPPVLIAKTYIEHAQWEAMNRRVDEVKTFAETRQEKRTVLRNVTRPGNAWDEYTMALGDYKSWGKDAVNGAPLYMYASGMLDKAERPKIEKVIASNLWRLDHLRQGAERADGQMPYNWYWKHQEIPGIISSRMLANLGVAQAKWLADRGRAKEAADVLLDVAVFGKDLSTDGVLMAMVGSAVYVTAFEELSRQLVAGKFDSATLSHLSRSLETLDREFPKLDHIMSSVTMRQGSYFVRESKIPIGGREWWSDSKWKGWRFAISPRGYASAAFTELDPYLQRFAKLEDVPYAIARTEAAAITAESRKSSNALLNDDDILPEFTRLLEVQREGRAKLRLLRAGITLLATGEMPAIPDPFGTNLLYRKDANSITIWSLGRDGKDQNGDGEYAPDISLTIPR
jgi:hypothetical protein